MDNLQEENEALKNQVAALQSEVAFLNSVLDVKGAPKELIIRNMRAENMELRRALYDIKKPTLISRLLNWFK